MQVTINDATLFDPGIVDPDNPRSMVNIAPPQIQEFIQRIPRRYFLLTETQLNRKAKPDFTAKCLRIQFWQEYVRAQDKNVKMSLSNIIKGVTHKDYFVHLAKTKLYQFAWICIPPKSYDVTQKQILEESLEKLREIVRTDLYDVKITEKTDAKGQVTKTTTRKLNAAVMQEVRKTTEMLQQRILGQLTQNIKHDVTVETREPEKISQGPGLVALNALNELEKSLDQLENGDVIEHPPLENVPKTANEMLAEHYGLDRTDPEQTLDQGLRRKVALEEFEAVSDEEILGDDD